MKKGLFTFFTAVIFLFMLSFSALGAKGSVAGKVVTEGGNLNLRAKPSSASAVLGSVKNGSWLTVEEKTGSWYKVLYGENKRAYVSTSYIKAYTDLTYEAKVKLTSGALNVRSGASTSHSIKHKLYSGEKVVVMKSNDTWSRILYDGSKIGYVAKKYLVKSSEESTYSSLKLSVPSFKQTDSRWSSYPIGTKGGTIGTIGCTTTALSMVESYHSGKTVTPPEMVKKLSYSASGSLYWPSTHSVSVADNDYLKVIYDLLKKGKPVVFGMKTAKGNQHWVVVYGFTGGDSLSASSFLINDPGSNSRTTLQSVLNAYPYAYKIVYKK